MKVVVLEQQNDFPCATGASVSCVPAEEEASESACRLQTYMLSLLAELCVGMGLSKTLLNRPQACMTMRCG